jgi:hypothetical protein
MRATNLRQLLHGMRRRRTVLQKRVLLQASQPDDLHTNTIRDQAGAMVMPTKYVPPRLLLRRRGVRVWNTYPDDDYDQGPRQFWFTLDPGCGEGYCVCLSPECAAVFDVRKLPTYHNDSSASLRAAIVAAISIGLLRKPF